jgi:hypothetical protein
MFEALHGRTTTFLSDQLDVHICIKVQFKVQVDLINKNTGEMLYGKWLTTCFVSLTHPNFIRSLLTFTALYLNNTLEIFNQNGSGYTLSEILRYQIIVAEKNPKAGGENFTLPIELKKKKGLLNLGNTKKYCFHYCIAAGCHQGDTLEEFKAKFRQKYNRNPTRCVIKRELEKAEVYMPFLSKFCFDGLRVPVPIEDINIFTAQNDISINLYGLRKKKLTVLMTTTEEKERHLNLLFLDGVQNEVGHYVLITNLSAFLSQKTKNYRPAKHNIVAEGFSRLTLYTSTMRCV